MKTPLLESLFNRIGGLQQKCFPLNIAEFLRTPILKNICERLLLEEFFWDLKSGISQRVQSQQKKTWKRSEICSKSTTKMPERHQ